jgi:hypothetical protein
MITLVQRGSFLAFAAARYKMLVEVDDTLNTVMALNVSGRRVK